MEFNCIKDFHVDLVDDNGFPTQENGCRVRKGSMWRLYYSQNTLTGAEIKLENLTGLEWIEISRKRLFECFEVLECDEHCRKNVTCCNFWDTEKCKLQH
ncbi:hypothetical protein [Lacrimispora amygdalina]|uniref:hypothetical protein n=1 Tax=Lacrimispora amygdalina TaxID=253257 RepID=UPI000BE328C6|nr:hypothetical protein [Lacrimispora amygdalina]